MSYKKWTDEEEQFIKDNHSNMSCEDIGKKLGRSKTSVYGKKHNLALCAKINRHGLKKHPLYSVWKGIKTRCNNPKSKPYHCYGGRGISICKEWNDDFQTFYNWATKNGWKKGLEIDRIDNDGNYEPSNCRFVTSQINNQNKSTTQLTPVKIRFIRAIKKDCTKITMRELGQIFGISRKQAGKICSGKSWSNI